MVYKVLITENFSAAHRVKLKSGEWESIHGHNYKVEVCVSSKELNEEGMVIDFLLLDKYLKEILNRIDHTYLNENPNFINNIPTSENIAKFILAHLSEEIDKSNFSNSPKVEYVKVYETDKYASIIQI